MPSKTRRANFFITNLFFLFSIVTAHDVDTFAVAKKSNIKSCRGDTIFLEIKTNVVSPEITWLKGLEDKLPVTKSKHYSWDADRTTMKISDVHPSHSGHYSAQLRMNENITQIVKFTVVVQDISLRPHQTSTNIIIPYGGSTTLRVSPYPTSSPYLIQWKINGNPVYASGNSSHYKFMDNEGQPNAALVLEHAQSEQEGTYEAVMKKWHCEAKTRFNIQLIKAGISREVKIIVIACLVTVKVPLLAYIIYLDARRRRRNKKTADQDSDLEDVADMLSEDPVPSTGNQHAHDRHTIEKQHSTTIDKPQTEKQHSTTIDKPQTEKQHSTTIDKPHHMTDSDTIQISTYTQKEGSTDSVERRRSMTPDNQHDAPLARYLSDIRLESSDEDREYTNCQLKQAKAIDCSDLESGQSSLSSLIDLKSMQALFSSTK
ncbi:uncharacterized protein LOC5520397 isoform X1 [Nematostella vectensis]|uniref:uncharacterized protein LOC5520397 isoform X1 n=1 Tax=Nematostella vectensis TaxID=45351 RepID=UPI0020776D8B|nr:uncharacterized protein LOC5520397 isoform X1 [Nematostella vectensis]